MKLLKTFLNHLLVPHDSNNYRAKALQVDFLSYYLIFVLLFSFGFKLLNQSTGSVLGFATDITVNKLHQLTNEVRLQNQLQPFTYNEQLATAAQKKAEDMFAKNYWSHYAPDGTAPWDFFLSSGYRYEIAGENLAKNFLYSQGVIDAWMDSPSHRENILKKDYTEVGFAIVNGILNGEETTLVVEMFGKPIAASVIQDNPIINELKTNPQQVQADSTREPQSRLIEQQTVLAQSTSPTNVRKLSFNSSLIFLTFLLLTLIMDLYFVNKLKVIRITGKNLAHLIFLGFIFGGLFILIQGSII